MSQPFPDEPPIYIGVYVDDFQYFSISDKVEKWFEQMLPQHVKVDFMGPLAYFLGSRYVWYNTSNGLAVHISQPGFTEQLIEKFGMEDSNCVPTPYRSGLVIDRIEHDNVPVEQKPGLIKWYQSLMGD
jgi:hypothetical protein